MEEPPSLEVGPFQDTLAIEDEQLCHGLANSTLSEGEMQTD